MTHIPKQSNLRGHSVEMRYMSWLHNHGTCCLSGRIDIEIAHTGGLAQGKGLGRKANLSTCLPLSRPLHHAEERSRAEFWTRAGFPNNQHLDFAERLYDLFETNQPPADLFADMQAQADRAFLAEILRRET